MRLFLLLALLVACPFAAGQEPSQKSLFQTVRPQVSVVVREHPSGSEVVLISMLDPKYPLDLLRKQAQELAQQLGQEAQGLTVYEDQPSKEAPDIVFVRAQLGVNGLADEKTGVFRLQPIARAFAGTPDPHTIEGIGVFFENMAPGANTLRRYEDEGSAVELAAQSGQIGVEYRIRLRQQDPSKIVIPESRRQPKKPVAAKTESKVDWLSIILGVVAALALGALVYSLLLRVRPRSGPTLR